MSADKHRSLARRRRLLAEANAKPLRIDCEGGIGGANRDLARLVGEGHLRIARYAIREGDRWPAPKRFRNGPAGIARAPRTRAVITASGLALLGAGR